MARSALVPSTVYVGCKYVVFAFSSRPTVGHEAFHFRVLLYLMMLYVLNRQVEHHKSG